MRSVEVSQTGPSVASMVRGELRSTFRRPQFVVVAAIIIGFPPVYGTAVLPSYALMDWMDYLAVMLGGIYALVFPLLVTLLVQSRLLDEWSNSYASYTRTRVSSRTYFGAKVLASATIAAAVYALAMGIAFAWSHLTYSDHGMNIHVIRSIESASTWTQLYGVSPALYPVVYTLWVALVAATVGVFATLLAAVISNKFVAIVAPLGIHIGAGFGLAVLWLEEFMLPPFRFNLIQLPIWTEVVPWAVMMAVCAGLYAYIHFRGYRTSGIERG